MGLVLGDYGPHFNDRMVHIGFSLCPNALLLFLTVKKWLMRLLINHRCFFRRNMQKKKTITVSSNVPFKGQEHLQPWWIAIMMPCLPSR